jgi:glucose/arabinose dehydrogenase
MLAFGPDGYLYIGLGDGGGAGDTFDNGQNRQTWLGKLLRIDVDSAEPYAVPSDNPFVSDSSFKPEIWAYGLRNPWRFSFDRETNELYIGDVGQNRYEFIHYQPADSKGGQNFGWPIIEGIQCFRENNCDRTGLTQAIVDYPHELGCSVTGGYVYRGQRYPELRGVYIFGDYCSGRIWALTRGQDGAWQLNEAFESGQQISSFGEDAAGELYVTDLATGQLLRITAAQQ